MLENIKLKRVEKPEADHKAAFVGIMSKEPIKLFETNEEFVKRFNFNPWIIQLILFSRFDNRFGFVGWNIENWEDIEVWLLRELNEELPVLRKYVEKSLINWSNIMQIVHRGEKEGKKEEKDYILYVVKLTQTELMEALADVSEFVTDLRENKNREILWYVSFQIIPTKEFRDYNVSSLIKNLLSIPAPDAVKAEIVCILKEILEKPIFKEIVKKYKIPRYVYEIEDK